MQKTSNACTPPVPLKGFILYENAALAVCCKPAGIESESGMPALLRQTWGCPDAPVFCVHRLDTATGGVMVYAKTKAAAAFLSRQIADGGLQKRYLCVCAATPTPPQGQMEDFLWKDSRKNKVFSVKSERKGAKKALLEYEVLKTALLPHSKAENAPLPAAENSAAEAFSLCRVLLHTGRTHQIRVQFASRKHSLFGDGKYGSRQKGPLGLWCESLTFTMPGEAAPRTFCAPPPNAAPWMYFTAEKI